MSQESYLWLYGSLHGLSYFIFGAVLSMLSVPLFVLFYVLFFLDNRSRRDDEDHYTHLVRNLCLLGSFFQLEVYCWTGRGGMDRL